MICYDCNKLKTQREKDICNGIAYVSDAKRMSFIKNWLSHNEIAEINCSDYEIQKPNIERQWSVNSKSRGFGDTVAKITSSIGIKPCGGCKKRQQAWNKMFPYDKKEDTK